MIADNKLSSCDVILGPCDYVYVFTPVLSGYFQMLWTAHMAQWIAREFPKLKVVKGSTRFESHCYQVQGDSLLSSNLLLLNNVISTFPIHTMCSSMCYECTGFVSSAFEYSRGHWPLTFRSLDFAGKFLKFVTCVKVTSSFTKTLSSS